MRCCSLSSGVIVTRVHVQVQHCFDGGFMNTKIGVSFQWTALLHQAERFSVNIPATSQTASRRLVEMRPHLAWRPPAPQKRWGGSPAHVWAGNSPARSRGSSGGGFDGSYTPADGSYASYTPPFEADSQFHQEWKKSPKHKEPKSLFLGGHGIHFLGT